MRRTAIRRRTAPEDLLLVAALTLAASGCRLDSRTAAGDDQPRRYGLGAAAPAAEIAALDIDVNAKGAGLPAGSGTAEQGAAVYASNCATCHGVNGEGQGIYPKLLGGPRGPNVDFSSDAKIARTIGNYW